MPQFQLLHQGCISSVFATEGVETEHKVIKAYHKGRGLQPRHWLNISREVAILTTLRDLKVPGIVQLQGVHDDAANRYLVFEPCPGGDLYKRLAHCGLLQEEQLCREVIIPLLKILVSLHALGIIHRDIKPENIFFDADGALRLGDFGLAICTPDRATSRVGTLDYMAPEVLAQPSPDVVALRQLKSSQLPCYDSKVDIWALGVLVYESLMGIAPFGHADPEMSSLQAQFRRPAPLRPGVSSACADFVSRVLVKQAALRPTALQLLGHPWVQAHMEAEQAAVYSSAAQHWLGGESTSAATTTPSIERVTSCPAAASPENATPDSTQLGAPCAGVHSGAAPLPCRLHTGKLDKDSDRHRFINLSHFLHQTLKHPKETAGDSLAALPLRQQGQRQLAWERKVQQHRWQLSRNGTVQTAFAAAAAIAPGAAGIPAALPALRHGVQQAVAMQHPAAACLSSFCAATAGEEPRAAAAALPPAADCSIASPGKLRAAAGAAPAAQPLVAGSLPNGSFLCSSTPVSPIADKSRAMCWLLSPQQLPEKQYIAHSSRPQPSQQPAILAGLAESQLAHQTGKPPAMLPGVPVCPGSKLPSQRPPVLVSAGLPAGIALGADLMQRTASSPVLQCHILASPLPATIGVPVSPVALSPGGIMPAAVASPAGGCFHLLASPYRPAAAIPAAAECSARPHVSGAGGLVRHCSTGLIQLQLQQSTVPPVPRARAAATAAAAAAALAASRPVKRELLLPINSPLQAPRAQQHGSLAFPVHLQQHGSGSSTYSNMSSRPNSSASSTASRSSSPELPSGPELELSPESCGNSPACTAVETGQLAEGAGAADDVPGPERHLPASLAKPKYAATVAGQDFTAALDRFRTGKQPAAAAPDTAETHEAVLAATPTAVPAIEIATGVKGAALNMEDSTAAKKTHARNLWKKVQVVCKMVSKHRSMA